MNSNKASTVQLKGKITKKAEIKTDQNSKPIKCLLITKTNSIFSGGSEDCKIYGYLFNSTSKTFEYESSLIGHKGAITTLANTSNLDQILSGSADATIKCWNINNYTCLFTMEGHTDQVLKVIALEDSRIASLSKDKTIRIWSNVGKSLQTLIGNSGDIYQIVEIPKKKKLVTSDSNDTILFWDVNDYSPDSEEENKGGICVDFDNDIKGVSAYSESNCFLYVENEDKLLVGGIGILNIISLSNYEILGSKKKRFKGNGVNSIVQMLDGSYLIGVNSKSNQLLKFNKDFDYDDSIKYPYESEINCIVVMENNNFIITADNMGNLIQWEY